jgi:hypothetical protein
MVNLIDTILLDSKHSDFKIRDLGNDSYEVSDAENQVVYRGVVC